MRGLATTPRPADAFRRPPRRGDRTPSPDVSHLHLHKSRLAISSTDGEEWKTKRELAQHLKMTTRWIEMQQKLGLPVLRLGAANRYKVSEVEGWLRDRYYSDPSSRRS